MNTYTVLFAILLVTAGAYGQRTVPNGLFQFLLPWLNNANGPLQIPNFQNNIRPQSIFPFPITSQLFPGFGGFGVGDNAQPEPAPAGFGGFPTPPGIFPTSGPFPIPTTFPSFPGVSENEGPATPSPSTAEAPAPQ